MKQVLIAANKALARLLYAAVNWDALQAAAVTACTGEDALGKLQTLKPDLLLVEMDSGPFARAACAASPATRIVRIDPYCFLDGAGDLSLCRTAVGYECEAVADWEKGGSRATRLAKDYIEKHFSEPLRLDDVAEYVELNAAYFSALFKKETGRTFSEYLAERRLHAARSLLQSTGKSISEVAEAVGYNDVKYFSRLFKKQMGVKPSEYRRISL